MMKREVAEGFQILEWLSNSPDLNPIEPLERPELQLKNRPEKPTPKEELWVSWRKSGRSSLEICWAV